MVISCKKKKKNHTYCRHLQTIYIEIKKNCSWMNFIRMISKWNSKFWFTVQVGKHRRYLSGKQARLDHFLCAAGLKSWNGHIISKVLDSFCIPSLIAMTFICSYRSMYLDILKKTHNFFCWKVMENLSWKRLLLNFSVQRRILI